MSSSIPDTCIFSTDTPEDAKRKVLRAFTGGRASIEEQKKLGADPDICSVFAYFTFLFEEDDEKLKELHRKCKKGEMMCGECKAVLGERIAKFLVNHQKEREKAKSKLDKFIVTD